MLAPRKKLWSTPKEAVDAALSLVGPLRNCDVVYDVGCGDGRVLIHFARTSRGSAPLAKFVGVEIDETRAEEARRNVAAAGLASAIKIVCKNALSVDYSEASVIFLYLIPRGLRMIKPVILPPSGRKKSLKLVT